MKRPAKPDRSPSARLLAVGVLLLAHLADEIRAGPKQCRVSSQKRGRCCS